MLVLTRKQGETVCVGADVEVQVVAIDAGKVRLGFAAPNDVRVDRKEVRAKIIAEQEAALHEATLRQEAALDDGSEPSG